MRLSHSDIQHFNTVVAGLYNSALATKEPLQEMVAALPRLVGGCLGLGLAKRGCEAKSQMTVAWDEAMNQLLHAVVPGTHPCLFRRWERALCISDLVSRAAWRESELYNLAAPFVRLEDDVGVDFNVDGMDFSLCAISDGRSFSAREKCLTDLLRPHLRVLGRLVAVARSGGANDRGQAGETHWEIVQLRGEELSESARAVLSAAFPKTGCGPNGLPWPVEVWLNSVRARDTDAAGDVNAPARPFHLTAAGLSGRMEYLKNDDAGGTLLLRYQWESPQMPELAAFGLSRRETEVLGWLVEGKTNPELAKVLGIASGTVKRHLENIYAKLGVENRAAAMRMVFAAR